MKRNAFIVLLLFMAEALFAQQEIIMPPFLKAGDTIAVISPSSTPDSLTVAKGCDALRVTRCLSLCASSVLWPKKTMTASAEFLYVIVGD